MRMLALAAAIPACAGTIEGIAKLVTTGAPVPGATISVTGAAAIHTGPDGRFRFSGLAPGRYEILASADRVTPSQRNRRRVTLDSAMDVKSVEVGLVPQGSISGRVVDENRKPVKGVTVSAENGSIAISVTTEAAGEFEFDLIDAGEYLLVARPAKVAFGTGFVHWDSSGVALPRPVDGQARAWQSVYYPGVPDREQAQRVVLLPGASLTNFELKLRSVPVFPYEGRVLNEKGDPTRAQVLLIRDGEAFAEQSVDADASGRFRFPAMPEGDWTVAATHLKGSEAGAAFRRLAVTGPQRRALELRMELPFALRGRAELPASLDAAARKRAVLILRPETASPEFRVRGTPDAQGAVAMKAVHRGRYRVLAESPAGLYPESVKLSGQEILGQSVDLGPGSPPFEVVFREGKSRLEGRAEKCGDGRVIAIPTDPLRLRTRGARFGSCGVDGRFVIDRLPADSYRVVAFDIVPGGLAPGFEESLPGGVGVSVKEGESVSVNLTAAAWPFPLF